ncbi:ester cyclase [Gulosibacter molinativorax]|uniref:Ester cyclase n=1 Tax=Gulosibacter molinativorax TaxID=256821 RepID=A0ABT7C4W5_9MICO|nr:ester cyclase [Gulosibacter molinativorax]MDJ1370236.1 ester cyclase [Gulosibacter molinativorax]QUY61650.1 Hypotetical protein [Gulosibacter molinativorax]
MAESPSKGVVREFYARYPDLGAAVELFADGFVLHGPGGSVSTADDFQQTESVLIAAVPDARITVEEQIAEGEKVATRWSWRGTFQNSWMGLEPTGADIAFTAVVIDRVVDGRIEERWVEADVFGLMNKLGAIPPMQG